MGVLPRHTGLNAPHLFVIKLYSIHMYIKYVSEMVRTYVKKTNDNMVNHGNENMSDALAPVARGNSLNQGTS